MENYHWVLISSLIGAISGFLVAYWRTRYLVKAQDLSKRIEELCASISRLEELACEYWNVNKDKSAPSSHYITGSKTKIDILLGYMDKEYNKFEREKFANLLTKFFEACTGGSFGVEGGQCKPERQRDILISGEVLKIELMRFRDGLY